MRIVTLELSPEEITHIDQALGKRLRFDPVLSEKVVDIEDVRVIIRKVRRDA